MSFAGTFTAALGAERERWPLWLPVLLGVGVGTYFALPVEPWPWLGPGACLAGLVLLVAGRVQDAARLLASAALCVALGFTAAQGRTHLVAAPVVPDSDRPATVAGRIVHAEPWKSGVRLTLDRLEIERLAPKDTPATVRIVAQGWHIQPPMPGSRVSLLAVLAPPAGPAAPGAFDYARHAFFERLGGTGFALGAGTLLPPGEGRGFALGLAAVRHDLALRARSALPGPAGAVAAALLTGERAAIPDAVNDAMRDSGLFHLLSISGLHLSLVAGIVFFAVRAGLALVEPWALRHPIKKWAAAAAIVATAGYLALSGMAVPTQRAFLMTTIVLVAVMIDRSPFSMRLVAVAAAVILLGAPESLLGASFQLSFAAVVALIAFFEEARERRWLAVSGRGPLRRAWVYVLGVVLTSAIAGTATAPFAAYHFDRFATYGVAANLVAVPITGAWVMPWGLAVLALAPLGLEHLALTPMGWGIEAILATAALVASWPGAAFVVPTAPLASLLAITLGGLWLTLWRGHVRWVGLAGFVVAGAFWVAWTPPDALVDGEGKVVALRGPDGAYAISSRRAAGRVAETWLRRAGQAAWGAPWPRAGETLGWLACDGSGCVYETDGRSLAVIDDPAALADDCGAVDVVILLAEASAACAARSVVVDGWRLALRGAHALWLGRDAIRVETVARSRGDRPWTRRAQYER